MLRTLATSLSKAQAAAKAAPDLSHLLPKAAPIPALKPVSRAIPPMKSLKPIQARIAQDPNIQNIQNVAARYLSPSKINYGSSPLIRTLPGGEQVLHGAVPKTVLAHALKKLSYALSEHRELRKRADSRLQAGRRLKDLLYSS